MSLATATAAPAFKTGGAYQSAAFEISNTAVVGKGLLYQVLAANKNAATAYLFIFDNATTPAGSLVCPPLTILAGNHVAVSEHVGMVFANGVTFGLSSTQATYTALGTSDLNVHLQFGLIT